MRKTRIAVFIAALIGIAALTATYSRSQTPPGKKQGSGAPPATGWQANPEWVETPLRRVGRPGSIGRTRADGPDSTQGLCSEDIGRRPGD